MLYSKILISAVILFLFTGITSLSAGTGFQKYAGEFMSIDVSARSQAMGGAYISIANDVSAAFHNPAGLIQVQNSQAAIMHTWQFSNLISYDYIGFTKPLSPNKNFAVSLIRLGADDIKDSRNAKIGNGDDWRVDPSLIKNFNAADYVLLLSLAKRQSERFSWGLNFKLIRRNLAEANATGIGFDGGLLFKLNNKWRIGTSFRNITTTLIAWSTGEKELVSPTILVGTSYKVLFPGLNSYIIPTFDLAFRTESYPQLNSGFNSSGIIDGNLGGEFGYREVLFVRGGVDELQRLNFGLGIKIPHLNIDYAYTNFDQELGNSHRVGLIINF
ncbi:MAG: PorV/PorQ family protein [Calditrichia bacterium]